VCHTVFFSGRGTPKGGNNGKTHKDTAIFLILNCSYSSIDRKKLLIYRLEEVANNFFDVLVAGKEV
jgi:hypothetical protein